MSLIESYYKLYINKKDEYYYKHTHFNPDDIKMSWDFEGKDYPRVLSLIEFSEWIDKYNISSGNKLLSTYDDPELEFLNYKNITKIPYINGENDLHTLKLPMKDYDLMVFCQTLEHLYNPFKALTRIKNHIRPGGYVYTNAPTINIPHMTPYHFYGFTPMGLCMLFVECGFEIIEIGFWGCTKYLNYIFENQTWPDYKLMRESNGLMPVNDKNNITQCWILTRKSSKDIL